MEDAYRRLSQAKSLGFYNCCEMTTAFLNQKKEKRAYHFFSIFVLEERVNVTKKDTDLTPKLLPVNKYFSMGINRRVMTVSEAEQCYRGLQSAVGGTMVDIGSGELKTGTLEEVPPVFVQKNSTVEIRLNEVLKNNFKNGSYILEFFDTQKPVCELLGKTGQKTACEILFQYLPVNLFTISDRIGNFIFQFPSLNATVSYHPDRDEKKLMYHVSLDKRLTDINGYQLISELSYDNVVAGFGTKNICGAETELELSVGDASRICRTTLLDTNNQLIISRSDTSYIRRIEARIHMRGQFGKERELYDSTGNVIATVDISSGETIRTGLTDRQYGEEWITNRQYRLRTEELERRKEFLRYGAGTGMGRSEAIADLRELMQRGDGRKVYLWDPYLSAKDLLDTWYYTTTYGLELKAVTSRADLDKNGAKDVAAEGKIGEWIRQQRKVLQDGSNQYGINLELRCQWGNYGYPFHDRFLMVVDEKKESQVWSLGASVNSVGCKHHIIQKVLHPQMIVEAFEELWGMLSVEECLVWRSKQ